MTPARRRTTLAVALALLAATAGCTGTLYERSATPATVPPDALEGTGFVEVNVTAVPTTVSVLPPPLPGDVTATSYVAVYARPGPNATGSPGAGAEAGAGTGTSSGSAANASVANASAANASAATGTGAAADAAAAGAGLDATRPASLLVVSSPSVRVAGRQANPLASLTRLDLALAVLDRVREANATLPGPAGALGTAVEAEGDLRAVGEYEATLLGSRTTVVAYAVDAGARVGGNRTGTRAGAGASDTTAADAGTVTDDGTVTGNRTATGAGVRLLVATVEHGDDVVVVLGVTPRLGVPDGDADADGSDDEEVDAGDAALLELVERVEHDVGRDDSTGRG